MLSGATIGKAGCCEAAATVLSPATAVLQTTSVEANFFLHRSICYEDHKKIATNETFCSVEAFSGIWKEIGHLI